MNNIKTMLKNAGWPRIIITLFLLSMYIVSPFIGINLKSALGDYISKIWNECYTGFISCTNDTVWNWIELWNAFGSRSWTLGSSNKYRDGA